MQWTLLRVERHTIAHLTATNPWPKYCSVSKVLLSMPKASNGDTALHLAAAHAIRDSGDVIALLLASNADFTVADGQE
jgi:hypothetical protein